MGTLLGPGGFNPSGVQFSSLTPFGAVNTSVGGGGTVSVGPMGISTSAPSPAGFITPANTINTLGVASPFAQPFGGNNPITPNSFGIQNPFNPTMVTPFDGFNPLPFGSGIGPFQNNISPLSFQAPPGGSSGGTLGGANLMAGFSPGIGFGGSIPATQRLINPISAGNALAATPGFFGNMASPAGLGGAGIAGGIGGGIPMSIPMPNTSSFMNFLSTGGGSFTMSMMSAPQQGIGVSGGFGINPTLGGGIPVQGGFGGFSPGGGFGQTAPQIPTGFMQSGPVNPFTQFQQQTAFGGSGGRAVTPFGTFTTSIGPMGGNANAGFLGAQASGQAFAMVTHPFNPSMIVSYANPFYSSFNFNQGFFAA
ncbi:MAG: hypothetical protein KTR14_10820 [Vampirovibrio sp.]|nr:hypothetical protein [Vampirovibrio sp.]